MLLTVLERPARFTVRGLVMAKQTEFQFTTDVPARTGGPGRPRVETVQDRGVAALMERPEGTAISVNVDDTEVDKVRRQWQAAAARIDKSASTVYVDGVLYVSLTERKRRPRK